MNTITLPRRFDPARLNARHGAHVHEASLAFTGPPENLPAFAQHCTTCLADELAEAYREAERLRAALEQARIPHFGSDDPWYACPAVRDAEYWPDPKDRQCTCGADDLNARIDAALHLAH